MHDLSELLYKVQAGMINEETFATEDDLVPDFGQLDNSMDGNDDNEVAGGFKTQFHNNFTITEI